VTLVRRAVVALLLGAAGALSCAGCGPSQGSVDTAAPLPDSGHANTNRRESEGEGRQEDLASEGDVDQFDEQMRLGDAALYSGRFEAAREHFLRAMDLRVDSMAPALGAIRALVTPGQADAREQIRARIEGKIGKLMEREDTVGSAWLLSARLALALHDPGRALDAAHLAVTELPEVGVSWRVLGEAALSAEHWGEAVDAFQTAVSLGLEAEAGTWERLADAFDELGDLQAAEGAARQAVEMTGKDPHAKRRRLNLLAVIMKHRGDLEGAAKTASEARMLGPDDPAVLHNLGSIAEARNRPEEAIEHYQKAVAEAPVPMTLWRLGRIQLELDRPNDALASFMRAAGNLDRWTWPTSQRWMPAWEVGKLFARANRWPDAIGWFEDALREARTAEAIREVQSWLAYARLQ
jgi:tetratricopeptide (TPR) repeat protein